MEDIHEPLLQFFTNQSPWCPELHIIMPSAFLLILSSLSHHYNLPPFQKYESLKFLFLHSWYLNTPSAQLPQNVCFLWYKIFVQPTGPSCCPTNYQEISPRPWGILVTWEHAMKFSNPSSKEYMFPRLVKDHLTPPQMKTTLLILL